MVRKSVTKKTTKKSKKSSVAPKRVYTKRKTTAKVKETPKRSYTKRKTKQDLVVETIAAPKNVAVTDEQLKEAKNLLNSMRAIDIDYIKRAFKAVDRSEWNKWTHVVVNGSAKKALSEAIAQALEI